MVPLVRDWEKHDQLLDQIFRRRCTRRDSYRLDIFQPHLLDLGQIVHQICRYAHLFANFH